MKKLHTIECVEMQLYLQERLLKLDPGDRSLTSYRRPMLLMRFPER